MTQEQFYTWLKDPSVMDASSIPQLREIIKRYPYFQAAHMMLAKNLRTENHIDQLNQLQLAAIMVPDRKVLHDYLHDKRKVHIPLVKELEEEVPISLEIPMEELPEASVEQTTLEKRYPDELIPEPIIYQLETAELPELPVAEEESEEEIAEPEELSFSEWLEYTQAGKQLPKPSRKTTVANESTRSSHATIDIIDHFLTQQADAPKKRAEFFNAQKVAAKSTEQDFTVVSETLAIIYFQQEKYELARQSYEALSLKYPEKSVYFAARLKEIDEKLNSE